nr:hypothetical protein [Tanacetum cinerariifolium]
MSLGGILLCITGEIAAVVCAGRWVLVNKSKCAKGRKQGFQVPFATASSTPRLRWNNTLMQRQHINATGADI